VLTGLHWPRIERLAAVLLQRREIAGVEAAAIIAGE
jgi:hypothetical protein